MSRTITTILQSILVIGQTTIPQLQLPVEQSTLAHAALGLVSAILGVTAHSYNPDGTPDTVAYVPPKPKP